MRARVGRGKHYTFIKMKRPPYSSKIILSSVKKIFGLNLKLSASEASGVAEIQWASIAEAHQKISEKPLSWIVESIYNTAITYFSKNN
jgi:hypothetical protein